MLRYFEDIRYQTLKESRATQEAIVLRILADQRLSADQLPAEALFALHHEKAEVSRAAKIAFACGYLVTELLMIETGCHLRLRSEKPLRELLIKA